MDLPWRILGPFLGARILKTGIAVFLSLAIFHWFGSGYATFAGVAAILAVQPSPIRAKKVLTQQLVGNIISGAVGGVLGLWLGPIPIAMALATVVVLGFCSRLKLNEAAGLAVVGVLFVMDRPEHDFLTYTVARVGCIIGGMFIGYLVNRYLIPPKFSDRLRMELDSACRDVLTFGQHLVASLAWPEHYLKEAIKQEAACIQQHLETVRYYLDLQQEGPHNLGLIPLEKAKASLFVMVERIMDIHKIVLQMGGLKPGPELDTVSAALGQASDYLRSVMEKALWNVPLDPNVAKSASAALQQLASLVDQQVDDPATRQRGLGLHGILTNVRHMTWRVDSLLRLLKA